MIGLVFVSHSRLIAEGVCRLAQQMSGDDVQMAPAGGMAEDETLLGTDAMYIMAAIESVWSDDGVLILVDMGSAVMNAEIALEFLPGEKRNRCTISNAPLVEGAIVAAVHAGLGDTLHDVNVAAEAVLNARKIVRAK